MRKELVIKLQNTLPSLANDLVFEDVAGPMIEKGILAPPEYATVVATSTHSGRAAMIVEMLAGKEDAAFDSFVELLRKDHPWLAEEIINGGSGAGPSAGDVTDSVPIYSNDFLRRQNIKNQCLESSRLAVNDEANKRKRSASNHHHSRGCEETRISKVKKPTDAPTMEKNKRIVIHPTNNHSPPSQSTNEQNITPPAASDDHSNSIEENTLSLEENGADKIKLSQTITEKMMGLVKKNHRTSRNWTNLAHALGLSSYVNKIRVKVLVFGEDLDVCVLYLLQEWVGENPKAATLMNLLEALRAEGFNDVADELVEKFAV